MVKLCMVFALVACARTPEKAPCDQASLAALVASCKDRADCHAQIEERERLCSKRIIEGPDTAAGGKSP